MLRDCIRGDIVYLVLLLRSSFGLDVDICLWLTILGFMVARLRYFSLHSLLCYGGMETLV